MAIDVFVSDWELAHLRRGDTPVSMCLKKCEVPFNTCTRCLKKRLTLVPGPIEVYVSLSSFKGYSGYVCLRRCRSSDPCPDCTKMYLKSA